MSQHAQPLYQHFLTTVVIPNMATYATMVTIGETFVAIAMLAGVATRLGGAVAMFLVLNYMLAKGMWFWLPASNDAAYFFIALALIIGAAGRTFGVDAVLARRWPRVPLW